VIKVVSSTAGRALPG